MPIIKKNDTTIFCWNIGNPSIERAKKQVKWLLETTYDVIILTETKKSKGCQFIKDTFEKKGYHVLSTEIQGNDYGVIAISKYLIKKSDLNNSMDFLSYRVLAFSLITDTDNEINLIGTYIPSRDASNMKIERKKQFITSLKRILKVSKTKNTIFCGDFNVLEPNHIPKYSTFKIWEYSFYKDLKGLGFFDVFRKLHPLKKDYSWVGRTGNGYRYDHCFCTIDLVNKIEECYYYHEIRENRLSDHSAIITILNI